MKPRLMPSLPVSVLLKLLRRTKWQGRSFARVLCDYTSQVKYDKPSASDIYVNHAFFSQTVKNPWVILGTFLVMALITWIILKYTVIGRHAYALGGNEQAARLSGIRTNAIK